MVAHVETVAFQGIEASPVDVQVHIGGGMPAFMVVGLPVLGSRCRRDASS